MVHEPDHILFIQTTACAIALYGGSGHAEIGARAIHELKNKRWAALIPRHLCNHSGKIAARAISADSDSVRIAIDRGSVCSYPFGRSKTILGRGWKFVLGCQPIIHGNDDAPGSIRQAATDAIMRIQVADHPAATVEVDEERKGSASLRGIDSDRDLAPRSRNRPILDVGDRFRCAILRHFLSLRLTQLIWRLLTDWGQVKRHRLLQIGLHMGLQRHALFSFVLLARTALLLTFLEQVYHFSVDSGFIILSNHHLQ